MKKVLLAAAVVATALTGSAQKWAVVGSYTDPAWKFEASTVMEAKGDGVFECQIAKLTDGFKIVDIANNDWETQYGTASGADLLTVGEPCYVVSKASLGGADPANISYADLVSYVENATVKFVNTETEQTVTVTGTAVKVAPELYVTGSFCNWSDPGTGDAVKMVEADGVYTATVNFGELPESGAIEWKIAGPGWSPQFAWPKGEEGSMTAKDQVYQLERSEANIKSTVTGECTVSFNFDTMEVTVSDASGVEGVEVADEAPVYFNLQGVQVVNPEKGVYIVKRGAKVSKEVVR